MKLRKGLLGLGMAIALSLSLAIGTSAAEATATYSQYWQQDATGNWHVYDGAGSMVKNAWLCDDAIQSNGQDVWYLLDSNGNMITNGLVQDLTGNYYSLETNHNGFFGMLRYKSGTYDGIYLDLESSHTGGFAKIKNAEGISALEAKCGLRAVSIDNNNCVYTSTFRAGGGATGGAVQQAPVEKPVVDSEGQEGNYDNSDLFGEVGDKPIISDTEWTDRFNNSLIR